MRSRLLEEISTLASMRFQERYVVNGTKLEYALPDEILESALSTARNAAQKSATAPLSPTEANAVKEFIAHASDAALNIDFHSGAITNKQLIEQDQHWAAARAAANRLLSALGSDLVEWERQQGLT